MRAHVACALLVGMATAAGADERIADLRQGTNIAPAISPDRTTLVVDLVGQLWKVPVSGGGAESLTPPGETARNPRFSPDGQHVVYERFDRGQWDLWLLDLGDLSRRALTSSPQYEREPDFSADGRAVVFVSNRTGHDCLWSIDVANGVQTQLTEEPGNASFPAVSEIGQIAYVLDDGRQSTLRVLTPGSVGTTVLASNDALGAPTWRPGGDVVVFSERDPTFGTRLRMLLLGGQPVLKTLTDAEDLFAARVAWVSGAEFIYAADGQLWRRGIVSPARQPVHLFAAVAVEDRQAPADLGSLDAAGPQRALGLAGLVRSPDGKRAVLTALGDLWLVERGKTERLTDDAAVDIDPAFMPDGDSVVFASDRTGGFELWRLALRDKRVTQLTFGAVRAHAPAPRPDGRDIAYLDTDGLGPWAPSRLQLLSPGRGAEPVTLASGLRATGTPTWETDGATLRVRAPTPATLNSTPRLGVRVELVSALAAGDASPAPHDADAPQPDIEWTAERPSPETYVVQVGRLFDGVRGDYRRHVDIHVTGGRITAIVGRGLLPSPPTVIDARDATVLPGFIDLHAHQSSLAGERLGRAWLAYGVTTVREIAADPADALARGEAWASGRLPGPRLVITPASGATVPAAAPRGSGPVPVERYPGIADGFGHSLARQARGVDAAAGDTLYPDWLATGSAGEPYELALSPSYLSYQDALSVMITSATVMTPALGALRGLHDWPGNVGRARDAGYRALFEPAEIAAWGAAGPAPKAVAGLQETIARLVRGGGRVAIGTDAPSVPYGLGLHLELALLAAAGLPNDQVLRLATAEGALALGLEQQIGTLEDGKLADFVVVDGDPLARLDDALHITAVVKGGVWHDRAALLRAP